jgi:hypothetical protein
VDSRFFNTPEDLIQFTWRERWVAGFLVSELELLMCIAVEFREVAASMVPFVQCGLQQEFEDYLMSDDRRCRVVTGNEPV